MSLFFRVKQESRYRIIKNWAIFHVCGGFGRELRHFESLISIRFLTIIFLSSFVFKVVKIYLNELVNFVGNFHIEQAVRVN